MGEMGGRRIVVVNGGMCERVRENTRDWGENGGGGDGLWLFLGMYERGRERTRGYERLGEIGGMVDCGCFWGDMRERTREYERLGEMGGGGLALLHRVSDMVGFIGNACCSCRPAGGPAVVKGLKSPE